MAHGIEGRVPFLDHKFFEFAREIPPSFNIKDNLQKCILRKIAKKYLTEEIYNRPKQPFMAPPLSLLKNKTGLEFLHDCFAGKAFGEMEFFNQKKAVQLVKKLHTLSPQKQIALEPVIMIMLSVFLVHKRFNLSNT